MLDLDAARRAWPEIHVSDEELARYLAERPGAPAPLAPERTLELYLACACARGDEQAMRRFEESFFGEVDAANRRLGSPLAADDARQLVRERLFLRERGASRIASWSGEGSLRAWLRVLASRAMLDRLRRPEREIPVEDALLEAPLDRDDPELALLKERCRPRIRAAVALAFAALEPRQKLLLRAELEGGSLDDLARAYDVHLRSVQRWLRDARDQLLAGFRRELGLGSPEELASMVNLMRSQLASSIASLVGA